MNQILITHVTSLELSRRLKELGVEKTSHFTWKAYYNGDAPMLITGTEPESNKWNLYSAYLASELGELLPFVIGKDRSLYYLECDKAKTWWNVSYENIDNERLMPMISEDNLADGLARTLIYLIENHLISVEELGK